MNNNIKFIIDHLSKSFEKKEVLNEKPVKTAVDEFAAGEYKIIEDPRLRR